MTPADSPAVLHVGGFVHTDGQFDLQLRVLAVLGDDHPVELRLLRPVGGWIHDHLRGGGAKRRAGIGQQEGCSVNSFFIGNKIILIVVFGIVFSL